MGFYPEFLIFFCLIKNKNDVLFLPCTVAAAGLKIGVCQLPYDRLMFMFDTKAKIQMNCQMVNKMHGKIYSSGG